jgi:outer membrane protein OmpA-like peptidoglycan-associated protein
MLSTQPVDAQFLKRLGKTVENAAKKTVERKAEQKTEEAVGKAIDKVTDPDTYKEEGKEEATPAQTAAESPQEKAAETPKQEAKPTEVTYAKSDFVSGDEIIFEDLMDNEQLGEFPSMWDLLKGVAEVAAIDGKKAIVFPEEWTEITPLMKEMDGYLPEQYTIEMDMWLTDVPDDDEQDQYKQYYRLQFYADATTHNKVMELNLSNYDKYVKCQMAWGYKSTTGKDVSGEAKVALPANGWHHLAISFNKRAFKAYMDGVRIANIPNMSQAVRFTLTRGWDYKSSAITNIRIAQGAVPLYDRMMTDGKIITYGITFDVGKATVKPESMAEINRIAKLMNENPTLKFSVEGHTDSTGNATLNQKLSDERSAAVVGKLVELGIAADRLQSAGKGQNNPIADNATDEGRAKNRRVEFVKR